MLKRTDTEVRGTYKIFNLLLDLPFLRIYEMLGIADNHAYLLLDYSPKEDPYSLREEMELWEKIQEYPFPRIVQHWEREGVFSFVLQKSQRIPWLNLPESLTTPQEQLLSSLPKLVQLFASLHEFQISLVACELLSKRLYRSAEGKFEILPAILFHVGNRRDPIPEGFKPNPKPKPVSAYTKTLGELLFYVLFDAVPPGDRVPDEVRQDLPRHLVDFLDFLISGKAETFHSVLENLQKCLAQKKERDLSEAAAAKQEKAPLRSSATSSVGVKFQLKPFVGALLSPFVLFLRAARFLLQMLGFIIFLVSTYYWEKMIAAGRALGRFYRWLSELTWEDIKYFLGKAILDVGGEFGKIATYFEEFAHVSEIDLLHFTRYLAILLRAGIPLARALEILHQQALNKLFKKALGKLYDEVVHQGSSLSRAMAASPKVFSDLYVNMVATGEVAGQIDNTLDQMATHLESSQKVKRQLKAAVSYPIIIAVACVGFFSFFVYGILPKFILMFQDSHAQLPLPTRVLVGLSAFAHSPKTIVLSLVTAVVVFFPITSFLKSLLGKERVDFLKLQLPIFGGIYRKVLMARFASTLGALLECGVPLLKALEVTGRASGNEFLQGLLNYTMEEARVGNQLYVIMRGQSFFPKLFISMVQVGEDAGQLSPMLHKIQEIYENDVADGLQRFLALIEPALMGVMGLVVGFVILGVFLPVYAIISAVK